MLADISGVNAIYIVTGFTDMRKSIDGLCAIIQEKLSMDPAANSLFLFCSRRRDRIKAILKEPDGFVLIYKRLTAPVFLWLSTAFWYNKGIENVYHYLTYLLEKFPTSETSDDELEQALGISGVTMILSGMSNQEQLEKNLATFSEDRKLNETEMQTILASPIKCFPSARYHVQPAITASAIGR